MSMEDIIERPGDNRYPWKQGTKPRKMRSGNGLILSLVTWNMQGNNAGTENLWNEDVLGLFNPDRAGHIHIACLQECGNPPGSSRSTAAPPWRSPDPPTESFCYWRAGTESRPAYYGAWLETDPNGHRVDIAICAKAQPEGLLYIRSPMGGRPALGMRFDLPDGGFLDVYSVHFWSGNGNDGPPMLVEMRGCAEPRGKWIAAGDYNQSPINLRFQSYFHGYDHRGTIISAAGPTHRLGRILDYITLGGWDQDEFPLVQEGQRLGLSTSDHKPVQFDVPISF